MSTGRLECSISIPIAKSAKLKSRRLHDLRVWTTQCGNESWCESFIPFRARNAFFGRRKMVTVTVTKAYSGVTKAGDNRQLKLKCSRGSNVHCYYHVTLYIQTSMSDMSTLAIRQSDFGTYLMASILKSSGYSTRKSPFMSDAWRINRACRSNTLWTKLLIACIQPMLSWIDVYDLKVGPIPDWSGGTAAVLLAIRTLGMLITSLHPWSSA